ncbi:hypothetical protein RFI_37805 [Reticulomyxa filosa]|uniref:Uncharacterized protein n=1 Tax=Reticulomyxa filosa TaxID=46433 RepID=X6LE51_RETFI|nr:hypothetical protein RFI_37805 [Reticulomyxa filosa]|eukprot:ETN99665.1 hypothetical protein RFI_37805 [Reticulomyxa filosa]
MNGVLMIFFFFLLLLNYARSSFIQHKQESHQLISHFVPNQLQVGAVKPWWSDALRRKRKQVQKEQNKSKLLEIQKEKQEFIIKSIGSLQEGNTKQEITEEVIEALRYISMNKAQGPDNNKKKKIILISFIMI